MSENDPGHFAFASVPGPTIDTWDEEDHIHLLAKLRPDRGQSDGAARSKSELETANGIEYSERYI